jgi:hypothetical protein
METLHPEHRCVQANGDRLSFGYPPEVQTSQLICHHVETKPHLEWLLRGFFGLHSATVFWRDLVTGNSDFDIRFEVKGGSENGKQWLR